MESQIGIVTSSRLNWRPKNWRRCEKLQESYQDMKSELAKVIVGQEAVIEELLIALFCRGHALLVGVPGLAKTLLISTLSRDAGLELQPHSVHAGFDAVGYHRDGSDRGG